MSRLVVLYSSEVHIFCLLKLYLNVPYMETEGHKGDLRSQMFISIPQWRKQRALLSARIDVLNFSNI